MADNKPRRGTSLEMLRFRTFEWSARRRRLRRAATIGDLRRMAKRRLPRGVFDYIDGGAEDEITLGANEQAYRNLTFVPRVLRDVSKVDTSSTLLGTPLPLPLVLAPTGFTRIAHPDGELAVGRASRKAGIPYALSTMGTRSIEELAAVGDRLWFQVYVWKDRALVRDMVERAAAAGYEALCITVDAPVLGRRERDVRRGYTLPPKLGPSTIVDGILHPAWTWQFLTSKPIRFANVTGTAENDGRSAISLAEHVAAQFDQGLSWSDIEWFREIWSGPIVVKGIQSVADAVVAADHGIEAIAVSNHGGRQLDFAPAPLDLIPAISDAVGDRLEIICDGGARRGSDIVKALALGADAVMAGRPYLYALATAGELGVDHILANFATEMERTMALLGVTSVDDLDAALISGTSN